MSRFLSSVAFLCLSLLWTINCEDVRIDVDYEVGNYQHTDRGTEFRIETGGNFGLTCKQGDRFLINLALTVKATKLEECCSYENDLRPLRPLCEFSGASDFSESSVCRFVEDGEAPSSIEGAEEDPCTLYYDARRVRAEKRDDGVVELKLIKTDEIYLLRPTRKLMDNAQTVPKAVDSAQNVNSVEDVTFKVKYEVGTYPKSQKRSSLWDKWDFKPDLKDKVKYLEFSCGPSKPVQLNCQDEMCFSIGAVPADGDSGTIVAYVVKQKNEERYSLVKPKKKMPQRHFCTLVVSPDSYKVGFPKLGFYKKHINILHTGSEDKRGFRLFRKSFNTSKLFNLSRVLQDIRSRRRNYPCMSHGLAMPYVMGF